MLRALHALIRRTLFAGGASTWRPAVSPCPISIAHTRHTRQRLFGALLLTVAVSRRRVASPRRLPSFCRARCTADVAQSKEFLQTLGHGKSYALDCGAGIGRVSKELLLPIFGVVDLVEQNPQYVAKAKELIPDKRLANFYVSGLQSFTPVAGRYDVIWVQWVLGHLPDDDFVAFFKRCKLGRKPNGFICVKENALQ